VFHIPSLAAAFGNPAGYENVNGHQFQFDNNIDPFNNQEATEISVKLDNDLGWANLTAWALYSDIQNDLGADGTSGAFQFFFPRPTCISSTAALAGYPTAPPTFVGGTPGGSLFGAYTPTACDGTQYQVRDQKDYSFEVRLASNDDEKLRWLVGAYLLDLEREVGVNTGEDTGAGVIKQLFTTNAANATQQLAHDEFNTGRHRRHRSLSGPALRRGDPQGPKPRARRRHNHPH
jgi:iron complex outermembrane recepter protein